MSFVNFTTEESVGVKIIDEQHNNIAHIINEVHSSFGPNKADSIKSLLNNLAEAIELHFETEEKLMKDNSFTGYFSHKLEHDRFYKQLIKTTDSVISGNDELSGDTLDGLRRWFFNHIEINDKKCGRFLNTIGIK